MDATKAQTWKLFTLTKVDYRKQTPPLTAEEASRLITEYERGEQLRKLNYRDVWRKALDAGKAALDACTPRPMVVEQHSDVLNDNSPVAQAYYVADGLCGFGWVNIPYKGANIKFINEIKKIEPRLSKNSYRGGYEYWVWEGNQSYEKKKAFAEAMAKFLRENGINCCPGSALD